MLDLSGKNVIFRLKMRRKFRNAMPIMYADLIKIPTSCSIKKATTTTDEGL
jgi:hypothetical protein